MSIESGECHESQRCLHFESDDDSFSSSSNAQILHIFRFLVARYIHLKRLVEEVPKSSTWESTVLKDFSRETPQFSMAIFNMGEKYLSTYYVSGLIM